MGRSRERRRSRSRSRRRSPRRRSRDRREPARGGGRDDRRRDERRDRERKRTPSRKRSRGRRDRSPLPIKSRSRSRERESDAAKGEKFRFDSPPKAEEIEKDNKPAPINPFTQLPGLQSAIGVLNPQQLALPGKMAQNIPSALLNMLPPPDPNPLAPSRLAQGLAAIAPPPRPLEKLDTETKKKMISISNLPLNIAQPQLRAFINQISIAMNIGEGVPGDPVKNVTITSGSPIGMVEFQTEEQATKALKLDGVELLGVKIKVQKAIFDANDNPTGLRGAMGIPGAAPGVGPEIRAPNVLPTLQEMMKTNKMKELAANPQQKPKGDIDTKLALSNIPRFVQEKAINDLLCTFGKLKFYRLLTREEISDEKENIVFFEYFDPEMQVRAKTALQGLDLGKQSLVVMTPDEVLQSGKLVQKQKLGDRVIPTRILYLKNLVKPEDLYGDEDYEEICNDVRLECECFGEVLNLEVPRPHPETVLKAEIKAREKAKENQLYLDRQARIAKGEVLLAIGDTDEEKKDKEEGEKKEEEEKKRKEEEEKEKEKNKKKEEEEGAKMIQDVNPEDAKMKKEDKKEEEEEGEEVEMEPNAEKKTSDSALKDESEVEKKEGEEEEEEKSLDPPGVGFAFVEFEDLEGASKAKKALNGRRFGVMEVVAEYFNEDKYEERDFDDVKPNTAAPKTQKVKPSEDAPEEEEIEFIW